MNQSTFIGPYRILRPLGSGGMGEARLVARLNHPSIVQVYDVVEAPSAISDPDRLPASTGEGSGSIPGVGTTETCLVMEYVEGRTLRELAGSQALEPGRVVALAAQVAAGLAEAHRRGIVHRDLKTETVMVTPDWQAKITDFGIAKSVALDGTDDGADDGADGERLTGPQVVIGTRRTMSPEQVLGAEVDHRSDLFSFGVLLYESLTGISPFEGPTPTATARNILDAEPRPVLEILERIATSLPSAGAEAEAETDLGIEIEHGAEARRHRLPRGRRAVALALIGGIALAAGAVGIRWILRSLAPPAPRLYVAALEPRVEPGEAGLEPGPGDDGPRLLAATVRLAALRTLLALDGVSARDIGELRDAARGAAGKPAGQAAAQEPDLERIAEAIGADELVTGEVVCRVEACQVTLSRVRGADGVLLWTAGFEIPRDDLLIAATATSTYLGRAYQGRELRQRSAVAGSSQEVRRLLELRWRLRAEGPSEQLAADVAAESDRFPGSLELELIAADVERARFHDSREPARLERATELFERAAEQAPFDPRPRSGLVRNVVLGRRVDQGRVRDRHHPGPEEHQHEAVEAGLARIQHLDLTVAVVEPGHRHHRIRWRQRHQWHRAVEIELDPLDQ